MKKGLGQVLSAELLNILPNTDDADGFDADFFGQSRAAHAQGDGAPGPAIPISVLRDALPSRWIDQTEDDAGNDTSGPDVSDIEMTASPDGETLFVSVEDGYAKPAHAGGGKSTTDTTTDTTSGGKGNGKKSVTIDPSTSTDATTDPTTDTTTTTTTDTTTDTGTATDTSGPAVIPDYISGLDTPDGFNIEVIFEGAWTDALITQFTKAAETISDFIIGDLPDVNGIDDIRITASIADIDGSGGRGGQGGFDAVRADSFLVSEGHVTFDAADTGTLLNYGIFDDMALHEMIHSLGFGSGWSMYGLVQNFDGDLRFIGDNATAVYNSLYASIAADDPLAAYGVPIETDGGSGTAGSHWDEATFGREIMTGTLSTSNTVSDMTIAALEDMGYDTVIDTFLFV